MRLCWLVGPFLLLSACGAPMMAREASRDAGGRADAGRDSGAPHRWQDISREVEAARAAHGMIALGGAVVDGDGAIAIGVAGLRRVESDERVELDDRWHLGSDGKAMTATLAAILVDEGALSWSTTSSDVFAALADRIDPALRGITLVHLLNHRAGFTGNLPGDHPDVWARVWENTGPLSAQRSWLAEQMLRIPPVVAPESAHLYSNEGFVVAGAMLEARTGESFEALLRARLFEPLQMVSCGFGAPGSEDVVDEPRGHRGDPLSSVAGFGSDNPPAMAPAGTMHCSLEDWARFAALHLRGARGDTELLPRAAFERLHSAPFGEEYAHGWTPAVRDWAGGTAYAHAGSNTFWYAVIWLAPAIGRAYLAVTNVAGPDAEAATDALIIALRAWSPEG